MVILTSSENVSYWLVYAVVPLMAAFIGGGGIIALLRWRPERDSVIAQASEAAVAAVQGSMEALRDQLTSAHKELEDLRAERLLLLHRIDQLEKQQKDEITRLRAREEQLLVEIAQLKLQVSQLQEVQNSQS